MAFAKTTFIFLLSVWVLPVAQARSAATCAQSVSARQFEDLLSRYVPTGREGAEVAAKLYVTDDAGGASAEIYSKNATRYQAVASTQKILSAWVVYKYGIKTGKIKLSSMIPYSNSYVFFDEQGGMTRDDKNNVLSLEYLNSEQRQGRIVSVSIQRLLYNLLITSANGSAMALAYGTAGSQENFVRLMNSEAKLLLGQGTQSYFQNAHGLTDTEARYRNADDPLMRQQSSASDLGVIMARMSADSGFRNVLLKSSVIKSDRDDYTKFGITRAAGTTVVTQFRMPWPCNGKRLIMSVFGRIYESAERPRNQIADFRLLIRDVANIIR